MVGFDVQTNGLWCKKCDELFHLAFPHLSSEKYQILKIGKQINFSMQFRGGESKAGIKNDVADKFCLLIGP